MSLVLAGCRNRAGCFLFESHSVNSVLLTGLQRFVLYPPSAGGTVPTYPYVHPYVTHASGDLHELAGVGGGMEALVQPGDLFCMSAVVMLCD